MYRKTWLRMLTILLGAAFSILQWTEPCPAGVPDIQLSEINEVVRVSRQQNGSGGRGTGSIFANVFNEENDTRYLCVLTADHVLRGGNGGSIAFANTPYNTNIGPFFAASHTALGSLKSIDVAFDPNPHKPDLGVMVVPVPDTAFFQGLAPFSLVTPAAYDPDNWLFDPDTDKPVVQPFEEDERYPTTLRGFGTTGPETWLRTGRGNRYAYLQDVFSYGTQRFSNNMIEQYELHDDGRYRDVMSINILGAGGVVGEGMGEAGDSGGPILNRVAVANLLDNNTIVPGFVEDIEGVFVRFVRSHLFAFDNNGNPTFMNYATQDTLPHPLNPLLPPANQISQFVIDFGNVTGSVTLISEYIDWANTECMNNVPEPATAVLVLAVMTVLSRRRRR